jgi:hypothetical protein
MEERANMIMKEVVSEATKNPYAKYAKHLTGRLGVHAAVALVGVLSVGSGVPFPSDAATAPVLCGAWVVKDTPPLPGRAGSHGWHMMVCADLVGYVVGAYMNGRGKVECTVVGVEDSAGFHGDFCGETIP